MISINDQEKLIKTAIQIAEKPALFDYRKDKKKTGSVQPERKQSGFSQAYNVPESLKNILNSDEFENFVIESTPKKGNNAYDRTVENPKITASQLVSICRNYFISQDEDNKGLVSLEDTTTPIYEIFSDYLEKLDEDDIDESYKPSIKYRNVERSNISINHMRSITYAYLKWTNNN